MWHVVLALVISAQTQRPVVATAVADSGIGRVVFPISCSPRAQAQFNHAVALLHHMTYPQARAAFEEVATTDPRCAMAHWGVAMTLFQPLWPTRPDAAARRRGWEEVLRAEALLPRTARERLFVAAAEAFFRDPASSDYWLRIRRWAAAMEQVYVAYPDDDEAAAFYALAELAAAPADTVSRTHADRAAAILWRVYQHNPRHPGAMHYLIHADDMPGRERDALDITRRYDSLAPNNPHALHMPTHIYTRLGDWDGVVRGNLRAAEAALRFPAGDHGELVWDEFPHAVEYLLYAYLQKGMDEAAAAQLRRLETTERLEPTFKTAFHLASTQARYALERHAWSDAAALPPRLPAALDWDRYPWPEAITWYARGLGAAHLGNVAEARIASARLDTLEAAAGRSGEELFVRNVRLLRLELEAWNANQARLEDSSVVLMRAAADLEAATPKHPVTPGPTIPAQELLGDLLMDQGHPAEARAAYTRSLELYPKRFNSLWGAARAARAAGDDASARDFYRQLLQVAGGGTRQPALKEAAEYVAGP